MDRNQITGLILMLVFITVYFAFFAPEPPAPVVSTASDTTTVVASNQPTAPTYTLSDSARARLNESKYGLFSTAAQGNDDLTEIETENLRLAFSSKGGLVKRVEIKDFQDYLGEPLVLVDERLTSQKFLLSHLSREIDLSELYFSKSQGKTGDTTSLKYTIALENGASLTYEYLIPSKGYEIGMRIRQQGLRDVVGDDIRFQWKQHMNRLELDIPDARNRSTVKYRLNDGEVDELSGTSSDPEEEALPLAANWVSFRQKFFTAAVINDAGFPTGQIRSSINFGDSTSIKQADMSLALAAPDFFANGTDLRFYYGPNNHAILKKVAPDFGENVELGWFIMGWINEYTIIPLFHFLERYISNYGIIIILMVIAVRIVLAPLTYTSHLGMAKMRVLKPEMDEIKERNKDDMQKAQQEQMALFQKVGINPLAGCIPMLLQMPILFAMFFFFPNSIELRQESFLWANDLSTYDSVLDLPFNIPFYGDHVSLFTLLMTASTILYTWSNSQITTVQGPMKTLQYIMPVMFLFFLNSYSAGLTFYYFVSNIVSFGQIALFRKFIDEDKIKRILEENKKKNATKKKSSFQSRLEEAMKAQQAKQQEKKKK